MRDKHSLLTSPASTFMATLTLGLSIHSFTPYHFLELTAWNHSKVKSRNLLNTYLHQTVDCKYQKAQNKTLKADAGSPNKMQFNRNSSLSEILITKVTQCTLMPVKSGLLQMCLTRTAAASQGQQSKETSIDKQQL